ncbi:MAG: DUF192 domain-containing protein [Rhodospirillaceae bacterium]
MISRVALLLLLLLAAPARADSSGPVVFGRSEVAIATQAGGSFRFAIEVAETPDQLHQGLMFRDSMADDAGMLFLLEKEDIASFWMRNTFLPLDMLFIARNGRITDIHRNAAPGSTAIISSTVPVVAVLEVNAGITARLGIHTGDRVIHSAFH